MSTTRWKLAAGLAGAVVSAMIAMPASAGTYIQTYPGSNCVQEYGGTSIVTPSIAFVMGSALNNSTSSTIFVCPMGSAPYIYDGSVALNTTKAYWWAQVYDSSSTSNINCQLISCNGDGSSCYFSPLRYTSGTGSKFLSNDGNIANVGYSKTVFMRCQLPGRVSSSRSSINSYTLYAFE